MPCANPVASRTGAPHGLTFHSRFPLPIAREEARRAPGRPRLPARPPPSRRWAAGHQRGRLNPTPRLAAYLQGASLRPAF